MKLSDALELIEGSGYQVSFEVVNENVFFNDHERFPDDTEPPIDTEEEAWSLAEQFAGVSKTFANITVVKKTALQRIPIDPSRVYNPVPGPKTKKNPEKNPEKNPTWFERIFSWRHEDK